MPRDEAAWLDPTPDGAVLRLWVVPGSSRAGIVGPHGDALRIRVTAPPAEGAANREVVRLLASLLRVPAGAVSLEAGAGGRRKRVRVVGLAADVVRARLGAAASVDRGEGRN